MSVIGTIDSVTGPRTFDAVYDGIVHRADMLRRDAADLAKYVRTVRMIPHWHEALKETMLDAENELSDALETVRAFNRRDIP